MIVDLSVETPFEGFLRGLFVIAIISIFLIMVMGLTGNI